MEIDILEVLKNAIRVPYVEIDRDKFLMKELSEKFDAKTVVLAIETSPAQAGIKPRELKDVAKKCIDYELKKCTALSAASGVPGGFSIVATIPADFVQYFAHMLRVIQKVAYIYSFPQLTIEETKNGDFANSEIGQFFIGCLGVMFACDGATAAVQSLSKAFEQKVTKTIANKALTKGTIYPVIKRILAMIGIKITKQSFSKAVSKVVPVIGGGISGALTYTTFKPMCKRLDEMLSQLNIAKPEYYENL